MYNFHSCSGAIINLRCMHCDMTNKTSQSVPQTHDQTISRAHPVTGLTVFGQNKPKPRKQVRIRSPLQGVLKRVSKCPDLDFVSTPFGPRSVLLLEPKSRHLQTLVILRDEHVHVLSHKLESLYDIYSNQNIHHTQIAIGRPVDVSLPFL